MTFFAVSEDISWADYDVDDKGMLDDQGKLRNFTGASGPCIYRGDQFPDEFRGNGFTPEPCANLVKRFIIEEKDGRIGGRDAYNDHNFLASTDERFRPVSIENGPDGCLYIVDMYRGIIQHKTYVTSYLRRQILHRKLDKPIGLGRTPGGQQLLRQLLDERRVAWLDASALGQVGQSALWQLS